MNKELGEHESVQKLENLSQLTVEQREVLRTNFVNTTGIQQKSDCGDCVKVWAKLYRNQYNAKKKETPKKKEDAAEQPKQKETPKK